MVMILADLMVGDLIFTKRKFHTSHVAMYIGDGLVVHAVPMKVEITPLNKLERHWVFRFLRGIDSVYRINGANDEERNAVARYAIKQVSKPSIMFQFKKFGYLWNCTELVWRSWLEGTKGNINLDPNDGPFISAKDLMDSPLTHRIKLDTKIKRQ